MLKAYLAGPMEGATDLGIGWREPVFRHLLELEAILKLAKAKKMA